MLAMGWIPPNISSILFTLSGSKADFITFSSIKGISPNPECAN
jgi:hypothetical protein